MKKKSIYVILFFALASSPVIAQSECDFNPCEDADSPLDGGVTMLVGAGAIYGWKKLRSSKRKDI